MARLRCVMTAAALLLLAGCGGTAEAPPPPPQAPAAAEQTELRKEFVILRELVKQHALQSEAGNEARVETLERHLRERLKGLPDGGREEEEREIVRRRGRWWGSDGVLGEGAGRGPPSPQSRTASLSGASGVAGCRTSQIGS